MLKNWLIKKIIGFIGSQKFLSVQLDITNVCNLKCKHCYQDGHAVGADLGFMDWCRVFDQYDALTQKLHLIPHFCLSGGEPTASPIFSAILDEIHRRWPKASVAVLTNGTCLSVEKVKHMAAHKVEVQVSVDGPDACRNDFIRGQGSFSKAIGGVKALRESGIIPTFQAVLSSRTAPWVEEFFELAAELQVGAMNFTRFVPQGKGKMLEKDSGEKPLHGKDLRDAYMAILRASNKAKVHTGTNLPLFVLISPELGAHGKFGFQGLVIDYRGNLKVSSRADYCLGNIFKSGLEELFLRHPLMEDLRNGKIEVCGSCAYYDRCGGDRNASFVEFGSFTKKDPGCWLDQEN